MQVLAAADPQEALHLLEGHAGPVDLLLTDMRLPGLNGPELADRVRIARPGVRVLFMSGSDAEHSPDAPPDADFLRKPFVPQELTDRVRRALGQPHE
jgi:CheY-like chemotaxis protein